MIGVDAPGRLGRHAGGALGGDGAHDVDVVGGQVERHSDIADPGREGSRPAAGDREHGRQPAGSEETPELQDRRIEPLDVTDLDGRGAGGRRREDDPVRLGGSRRERLLDEDGDPAFDGGQRESRVHGGRCRDHDGVDVRLDKEPLRIGEPRCPGSRGRGGQGDFLGVRDGLEAHSGHRTEDPQVVPTHRPEPDETDAQLPGSRPATTWPVIGRSRDRRRPRTARSRELRGPPGLSGPRR